MRHVIIGSGAAGIAAAKTIRRLRPHDEIVMVASDHQMHSRCMLHHYLSGKRTKKELQFVPDDFFEKMDIDYNPSTTVRRIDPENRIVHSDRGELDYDRLLIATGSVAVIPEMGNMSGANNAFGFRHLSDVNDILECLDRTQKIVIVGGGLIGLDAASALLELGKQVTVVEIKDRIMPMQMEPGASAGYQRLFEEHGCTFKLNQEVAETITDKMGDIKTLVLRSGEQLSCDLVLVTVGVRAACDFVQDCGITNDYAVLVDARMQTRVRDIYAAGNVTELSGIWPNAVQQGNVAGSNMCDEEAFYTDRFPFKNTANFYGLQTLSLGEVDILERDEVLIQQDHRSYNKLIVREGRLVGAVFQGDISNRGFWQYLVKNRAKVGKPDKSLWHLSYADFFSLDEKGEYVFQWGSDLFAKKQMIYRKDVI